MPKPDWQTIRPTAKSRGKSCAQAVGHLWARLGQLAELTHSIKQSPASMWQIQSLLHRLYQFFTQQFTTYFFLTLPLLNVQLSTLSTQLTKTTTI